MQTPNENQIKGKWLEFKGEIQKMWGKLTNDELDQTKGDVTAIRGLIQQRYGDSQNDFSDRFDSLAEKYGNKRDAITDATKQNLKN